MATIEELFPELKGTKQGAQQVDVASLFPEIDAQAKNRDVERQLSAAAEAQRLRATMSAPEAFLADIGATFSKIGPNLRRVIKGADDPDALAELQEIEGMQDRLRTAFPSATFGGEVAAPAAVAAGTMGLGAPLAIPAAGIEAAAFSGSESSPRQNLALGSGLTFGASVIPRVVSAIGAGSEAALLRVEDIITAAPDQQAGRVVNRYLNEMGLTIDDIVDARKSMGPGATIADVAEMKGVTQKAAMSPSGRAYQKPFEERQLAQQERLLSKIEDITGSKASDFYNNFSQMVKERADNARPLYEQAFAQPATASDSLLKRLNGAGAMREAKRLAKIQGREISEELTVEDLHSAKIAIDDMINSAVREGKGGRASALGKLKEDLLSEMPADYNLARTTFAGESEMINAAELGENIFSPKIMGRRVGFEELKKEVATYGADRFSAFQAGVTKAIANKIEKVPETADAARRIWTRPDVRKTIELAFDSPAQFDDFLSFLQKESDFTQTLRDLYQGSQTAQRILADATMDGLSPSARQAASKVINGEIDAEGMQELSRIMFDPSVTDEYILGVLERARLVSAGANARIVANLRNNWDKIWAATDRRLSRAGTTAAASGALIDKGEE